MSKKEKYINFIVEDLIKKTEIDYGQERINFPFPSSFLLSLSFSFHHLPLTPTSLFPSSFSKYIRERYGVRDEEVQTIWGQYRNKVVSLINNE